MKASIVYRVSVEGSLDRKKRSLELTRSGEGYWYRQASTIRPSASIMVSNTVSVLHSQNFLENVDR